eukprot:GGOE01054482.1.p2 GENE.GGOE01054482.1~~GGOE01054482.1.p2  ORF type:complete len:158 (-),score=32.92 GGOE01054482.1:387-860(-)
MAAEQLRPFWVGPDWVSCAPDAPGAQQLFVDSASNSSPHCFGLTSGLRQRRPEAAPPPVYRDTPQMFECIGILVPCENDPHRQRVIGLPSGPEGVTDRGAFGVHFDPGNVNINANGVHVNGPHYGMQYPHKQTLHYLKEGNFKAIFKKQIVQQVNQW